MRRSSGRNGRRFSSAARGKHRARSRLKMRFCAIITALLIFTNPVLSTRQTKDSEKAEEMFGKIQSYIPQVKRVGINPKDLNLLAGKYSDRPPELRGLREDTIYLFPDQTYFYLIRNDTFPLTIMDKGK